MSHFGRFDTQQRFELLFGWIRSIKFPNASKNIISAMTHEQQLLSLLLYYIYLGPIGATGSLCSVCAVNVMT